MPSGTKGPYHVQHDDEVWSADDFHVCGTNSPEAAKEIADSLNILSEIKDALHQQKDLKAAGVTNGFADTFLGVRVETILSRTRL